MYFRRLKQPCSAVAVELSRGSALVAGNSQVDVLNICAFLCMSQAVLYAYTWAFTGWPACYCCYMLHTILQLTGIAKVPVTYHWLVPQQERCTLADKLNSNVKTCHNVSTVLTLRILAPERHVRGDIDHLMMQPQNSSLDVSHAICYVKYKTFDFFSSFTTCTILILTHLHI